MDKSDINYIIDLGKKLVYKRKKIIGNNDKETFNIFESISDIYYRENLHSDILAKILDPNTPTIGNPFFLECFRNTLGISEDDFIIDKNVIVERENGKIDILIRNEYNQALIIENKINNAVDQENQLVRYMEFVKDNLGIENYKVIYLTLIPKCDKPPISSYNRKRFGSYIDELDNCLIKIAAININKNRIDAINNDLIDFLEQCINHYGDKGIYNDNDNSDKNIMITKVYLEQYKQLLEHLGVDNYMAELEQQTINEIYSDKEILNAVKEFIKLFSDKQKRIKLLGEAVIKEMNNDTNNYLTEFLPLDNTDGYYGYYKKMDGNIKLTIFIGNGDYWKDFGIGFLLDHGKDTYTKPVQNGLVDILKKLDHKDLFLKSTKREEDIIEINSNWVYVELSLQAIDKASLTIKDLSKYLHKWLDKCDTEFTKNITPLIDEKKSKDVTLV